MDDAFVIRAFQTTDADYEAVARINDVPPSARLDFEQRSSDEQRAFDACLSRRGHVLLRYVAEVSGVGAVAYAHGFHTPWAYDPRRFWCSVRCTPSFRRRGVGRSLYERLTRDLSRLGAAELQTVAPEDDPSLLELLAGLGFRERFRSWGFELDLSLGGGELRAVRPPPGISIASLPEEQARSSGWLEGLRALYVAAISDVPLPDEPDPEPSPGAFAGYLGGRPSSLPEACFVAREGDRYAGLCVLRRSDDAPDELNHLLTLVASDHRRRGVGRALKLETIAFARRRGFTRISTAVESNNPGMLALNAELGFVRRDGVVALERRLSG